MPDTITNNIVKQINSNNIHQTKYREAKYRNKTDSELFNKNQKEILNDILDLFNRANNIEKLLNENKEILENETMYSNFKIKRLEAEIENIRNEYESITNKKDYFIKNIYPYNLLYTSTANIDNEFNCITNTPTSYESKLYIKNEINDTTFVPTVIYNDLVYLNLNKSLDIISESQNDIIYAFDGNNNTYWINKITTRNEVTEVIASLEFEVPEDIITSRNVNELLIKPYPANSIDILDIEYKTVTGIYTQVPTYQTYCLNQTDFNIYQESIEENTQILDVDSIKFNFNPIKIHRIKITFKQKYCTKNSDNTKTFVIGFKNIDLRYNNYSNNYDTICFNVEFPLNKTTTISNIKPIFSNEEEFSSRNINFDFYNLYEDGTRTKILNKTPFVLDTNKLYVECKIKSVDCTPNILRFEVEYKLN